MVVWEHDADIIFELDSMWKRLQQGSLARLGQTTERRDVARPTVERFEIPTWSLM